MVYENNLATQEKVRKPTTKLDIHYYRECIFIFIFFSFFFFKIPSIYLRERQRYQQR